VDTPPILGFSEQVLDQVTLFADCFVVAALDLTI
jgi:hypothetical protein